MLELKYFTNWKLINLEETSVDRIDNTAVDFLIVERHLEGVMKMFQQFDSEYLIIPWKVCLFMEVDNYIDSKRNQCFLIHMEKDWMFEHRQRWEQERLLTVI
jgi:hypothetical protein